MPVDGKSDAEIASILTKTKRIALIGASHNPARPSHGVMRLLLSHGYEVMPVNPGLAGKELLGQMVYATLADVPAPIHMVDVFRNSEAAGDVIDEALALASPPATIWLQLGVINEDAARRGEAAGVSVVMDRCPAIEIPRLGL